MTAKQKIITLLLIPMILCSQIPAGPPGLFDNPIALFQEALIPVLPHAGEGSVQKTLRGFYLQADAYLRGRTEAEQQQSPSESGIFLDVAVRDADEIPKLVDTLEKRGAQTYREVRLPALKSTASQGLVIHLNYGDDAQRDAIQRLSEAITRIKERHAELK